MGLKSRANWANLICFKVNCKYEHTKKCKECVRFSDYEPIEEKKKTR